MKGSSILVSLSALHLLVLVASQSISSSPNILQPRDELKLPLEQPLRRIDTHGHYVPPFYKALLDSRKQKAGGRVIPSWDAASHLAFNTELGIETTILSVSTPGVKLSPDAPIDEGRTLARQINKYGSSLAMEYPNRFLFWATLTLPDLDGAIAKAVYALDTLGAAGVIIEASTFGEILGTPRYDPLYRILNDREAVVFVHPSNSPCPGQQPGPSNPADIPPFVIDFLLDTSRAALTLVYKNVTTNYPNIKFILAHSGGFLPFASSRAAAALAFFANSTDSRHDYYEKIRQFHVDLAVSTSDTALVSTTAFFKCTRVTFGTDYPYAPMSMIQENTDSLLGFRLSDADRRSIDRSNAYGLFSKFLKDPGSPTNDPDSFKYSTKSDTWRINMEEFEKLFVESTTGYDPTIRKTSYFDEEGRNSTTSYRGPNQTHRQQNRDDNWELAENLDFPSHQSNWWLVFLLH